ncbi:hypothetical protein GGF43_000806 [Coemansia sp. RSA 2618]|nr:hypothetical protein GGF43_000806 [Coemansia sp. RSA 2618]
MDGAWSQVVEYLQTVGDPKRDPDTLRQFNLQATSSRGSSCADSLATLASGGPTPLSALRQQTAHIAQPSSSPMDTDEPLADSAKDQWAIALLEKLSCGDIEPAQLSKVWQLPTRQLRMLCTQHLSLATTSGAQLAQLISAVATDAQTSLENQQLLLRHVAASPGIVHAVPAVVQSQIAALLPVHAHVVATGLLVPLLLCADGVSGAALAMVTRVVKSGHVPPATLETIARELVDTARDCPQRLGDSVFQAMDAVASAMPVDLASQRWCRCWSEILVTAVPHNVGSKKLGALMLHFANKFGTVMDESELGQLSSAAHALAMPLKKAIIAAANRQIQRKEDNKS